MKKIRATIIATLLIIIFISFSCQKENVFEMENTPIIPKSQELLDFEVYNENNTLNFPTLKDYEKAINYLLNSGDYSYLENTFDFESMRKYYLTKGNIENIPVEDPLFSSIVNSQGVIIIENHIYVIDIKKEKVYVIIRSEDCDYDDELVKNIENNEKSLEISTYSTNDNVLDIVNGIDSPKVNYCNNRKIGPFSLPAGVGNERIYWENNYFKAGIYNSLYSKMWSENGSKYDLTIIIKSGSYWKNANIGNYSISGTYYEYNSKINKTVYASYKRLTAYVFNVDYQYASPPGYAGGDFIRTENNYCIY